ncbi:hypothetical protein ACIRG4_04915 [Streptomyces sp. NPDC102395]|uniref:hypothetical protein n=1 Tax=Streptomyces sp. NPDC102395 TaxID=3366168 RepID=UPI0038261AAF
MYRDELARILTDAGVSAIVCDEQACAAHVRERAIDAGVTTALTAGPLDLQTLYDARIFAGPTRQRGEGTDDILEVARERVGTR